MHTVPSRLNSLKKSSWNSQHTWQTEPTPRFDAHRTDTQFSTTSTKYLFPAERSLLKLRSKQTRETNNFSALFWGESLSSTRKSTRISPTRGMACAMSHVILVGQSSCRVNDLGGKIPRGKFVICTACGKIFTKETCRMLSRRKFLRPFKAKWVLILQTIFGVCQRKIIAEWWSLESWEQRGKSYLWTSKFKIKIMHLKTKQLTNESQQRLYLSFIN